MFEKLSMGCDAYKAEMARRRECGIKEESFSGESSKEGDAYGSYKNWGLADVGKEFRGGLGLGLGL